MKFLNKIEIFDAPRIRSIIHEIVKMNAALFNKKEHTIRHLEAKERAADR